jgi:SAM-dependent methyltransferase
MPSSSDAADLGVVSDAWKRPLRPLVSRSPALRSVVAEARRSVARVRSRSATLSFWEMTPEQALRSSFNVVLNRDPSAAEVTEMLPALESGALPRDEFVKRLRGSVEFRFRVPFERATLPHSLHMSRCEFIVSLPRARTILDIGGGDVNNAEGALVAMGYPYQFEALTVIDLPADERHPMYRSAEHSIVHSRRGPVSYRYHSMSDLSAYADESIDLVYSGQSIEHVTEAEVGHVLREVRRVLRPGGYFALDTPNGRITRFQQAGFIDADHEVEYTAAELDQKLAAAGFEIIERRGLNYAGEAAARGEFDWSEAARNTGVFAEAEDCYLLAYVCRKPA